MFFKLPSAEQNYNLKFKIIKTFYFLLVIFTFNFLLLTFSPSVYAEVKIREKFGFGDIPSLGEGTSKLVVPGFSIATTLVVIYFLIGAFKYLASGGDKEAVAGARQMITHSMIGFIILIFAFLILQFLLSNLLGITILRLF